MNDPAITRQAVFEGQSPTVMARLDDDAGALLLQSGVSAIAYKLFDLDSPATAAVSGTIDKTAAIFNTLQTDARWTEDDTGYNFRWKCPGSLLAIGGHTYRLEILVSDTSTPANVTPLVFEFPTTNLLSTA